MTIVTNLRELAMIDPPSFQNQKLTLWDDWKDGLMFVQMVRTIENDSVDLSKIVGHSQGGYGSMTWGHMLWNLKRINDRYKELQVSPEYFLRGRNYADWSFINLEGACFISTGKHRTTIVRYLAHYNPSYFEENKIHGVEVCYYEVDKYSMDMYEEIRRLLKHPELDHLEFGFRENWPPSENYFYLRNPNRLLNDELKFQKADLNYAFDLLTKRGWKHSLFGSQESKYILKRSWF